MCQPHMRTNAQDKMGMTWQTQREWRRGADTAKTSMYDTGIDVHKSNKNAPFKYAGTTTLKLSLYPPLGGIPAQHVQKGAATP